MHGGGGGRESEQSSPETHTIDKLRMLQYMNGIPSFHTPHSRRGIVATRAHHRTVGAESNGAYVVIMTR